MKKTGLSLLLFLTTIFISCAQTNGTIIHDGITRSYIVYLPTTYTPSSSLPLVFVLHGFTQSANTIMNVSDFNDVAEANNFIVAYPQGVGNAWNTNSGMVGGSTADDIGFIEALRDEFQTLYNIDSSRVYSCGFSAGGYMSHRLACESNRCFGAIASVSGTMSDNAYNDCNPTTTTPVMQIHGTSDNIVSYNGGFGGKSVDDVISKWVALDGCPTAPAVTLLPDINTNDGSTVEKSTYSPCNNNSAVILMKVIGGGHQWPGTTALLGGIGNINRDINASEEIWNFFSGYSCPTPTGINSADAGINNFHIQNNGNGNFSVSARSKEFIISGYSLLDITGKIIEIKKQLSASADEIFIDLQNKPSGIYMLLVESEKQILPVRLVR